MGITIISSNLIEHSGATALIEVLGSDVYIIIPDNRSVCGSCTQEEGKTFECSKEGFLQQRARIINTLYPARKSDKQCVILTSFHILNNSFRLFHRGTLPSLTKRINLIEGLLTHGKLPVCKKLITVQLCPCSNQFGLFSWHIPFGEITVHVEHMIPLV